MFTEKSRYTLGLLRLGMGWIFLWAFLDKAFGLGFATTPDKAWIAGGSPTFGYLKFATNGPFADFFQSIAGNTTIDWLFMLGILFIGVTIMLGIFTRIGVIVGITMSILFYVSGFMPPEHNPFFDKHILYILSFILIYQTNAGQWLGLGAWWMNLPFIRKYSILK